MALEGRLRGIAFAKQFPNPAEPARGLFVAEQLRATREQVDWRVIAPVPYVPQALSGPLDRPFVRGNDDFEGIPVARPRYPVLPRRLLYTTVAPSVATCARGDFDRIAAEHGPHFVHAHALYPSGAAARRLAKRAGLPLVVTVHGSDLYSNLVRAAWRRELEETCAAASAIICVSTGLADDLVERLGVDEWRVQVVPDTYDAARFVPAEREPRDGRPVRLLSVGRLVEVKGHDVLLGAVAGLVAGGLDLELEVVGGGPLRPMLEDRARDLGIDDRVSFAGVVSGDELAAAMARADVFTLASHREGFGVVLVEAMATGLPVVATSVEGPSDIVRPEDGRLAPPGDPDAFAAALRDVVEHPERFDPSAISRGVTSRFGHEIVGRHLVEVFTIVTEAARRLRS